MRGRCCRQGAQAGQRFHGHAGRVQPLRLTISERCELAAQHAMFQGHEMLGKELQTAHHGQCSDVLSAAAFLAICAIGQQACGA